MIEFGGSLKCIHMGVCRNIKIVVVGSQLFLTSILFSDHSLKTEPLQLLHKINILVIYLIIFCLFFQ